MTARFRSGQRAWAPVLLGLAASTATGLLAYRRGALAPSGVAGAVLVGTPIFAVGGAAPTAELLAFFVTSSLLSKWQSGRKVVAASEVVKGSRRDLTQVLANGGLAAACSLAGRYWPGQPWDAAAAGALATVNADTWATEVGLTSRARARLITSGRVVPPGVSGGVTPLGLLAAAAGATLVGLVGAVAGGARARRWQWLASIAAAGFTGAGVDSLLGATVQARYRCPRCDVTTERRRHRCGTATVQTGGSAWLDNDGVNFLSSCAGAVVAARLA